MAFGSITYKDVEISHEEYLNYFWKYQSISHKSGKHYARICYIGSTVDPDRTYTEKYCKKHNLGKYAGGKAGGRKGLLSAAAGGIGRLLKSALDTEREEQPEPEKTNRNAARKQRPYDKDARENRRLLSRDEFIERMDAEREARMQELRDRRRR